MLVLIADDQDVVRQGLIKMISETGIPMESVLEAADGEDALRLALDRRPDLILVDIKMPRLNGIDLIERLRAANFESQIVIISAFNDFDYAKKAISFKVDDYLLKPVSKVDLYRILTQTQARIRDNIKTLKRLREQEQKYYYRLLFDFVTGRDALVNPAEVLRELGASFEREYFIIAVAGAGDNDAGQLELESEAAALALTDAGIPSLTLPREKNKFVIIANLEQGTLRAFGDVIAARALPSSGVCYGVSEADRGLQSLRKLYEQALAAMREAANRGVSLCRAADFKRSESPLISAAEYARMLECFNRLDRKELNSLLDAILFRISGRMPSLGEAIAAASVLINYLVANIDVLYPCRARMERLQTQLAEAATLFQVKSAIKDAVGSLYDCVEEASRKDHASYIVNHLVAEVHNRYPGKISLAALVETLGMNYNYVSGLFTRKMGITFSDYTLCYRLEKAMEYLKMGKYRIAEVSDLCGFYDAKYFSKAFKKKFGITPGEFRNRK